MNKMELTEQNLFDLASENTNRIYPAKAVSMEEQIREILQRQGMDNETIDVLVDARMLRESPLWVVKNDDNGETFIKGGTIKGYASGVVMNANVMTISNGTLICDGKNKPVVCTMAI